MELKHLEYFIKTADAGSTSQAAELLYTSQPNVSKVIHSLEKKLNCRLFYRTNKGVHLTSEGSRLYEYAQNILRNVAVMEDIAKSSPAEKFSVSCYPSHMISRIFCEHYNRHKQAEMYMEFLEGTLEETINHVAQHRSEIGITYYAHSQQKYMNHLMTQKKLEFVPLDTKSICVYAGRNSDLFMTEAITFEQLPGIRFIQSSRDFFSMEHQLGYISAGRFREEDFNIAVTTNCDNLLVDMLMYTDLCNLGIHFMIADYEQYGIRSIPIVDSSPCLVLGYVKKAEGHLSSHAEEFLGHLQKFLS